MNWYKIIFSNNVSQLTKSIFDMLMNPYIQDISVPSYGDIADPATLKQAINIATNNVLMATGQSSLNESQMNIIRRIDPDFLGDSNVQQQNIEEENVQTDISENGQGVEEVAPPI